MDATTGDIQLKLDSRVAYLRDCAHEQMSIDPIMADAESNTKSQQQPERRPKNHPPCETVLQVIGDLFQPFALNVSRLPQATQNQPPMASLMS